MGNIGKYGVSEWKYGEIWGSVGLYLGPRGFYRVLRGGLWGVVGVYESGGEIWGCVGVC